MGLRELQEETGLRLAAGTFTWRLLGLWEVTAPPPSPPQFPNPSTVPPPNPLTTPKPFLQSVYPPMLSRGPPRRHHIVAYLLLRSQEPHEELEVSPLLIPFLNFLSFFFLFFLAPPTLALGFRPGFAPARAR